MIANLLADKIAVFCASLFVLLGGLYPMAKYNGNYTTLIGFPKDTWFGIMFLVAYIAAVLGLFLSVKQIKSIPPTNAYIASALFNIATIILIGGSFIMAFAVRNLDYNYMLSILQLLAIIVSSLENYIRLEISKTVQYLDVLASAETEEEMEKAVSAVMGETTINEDAVLNLRNTLTRVYLFLNSPQTIFKIYFSAYMLSVTAVAIVLFKYIPIVHVNGQLAPLVQAPFASSTAQAMLVALLLSYGALIGNKSNLIFVVTKYGVSAILVYSIVTIVTNIQTFTIWNVLILVFLAIATLKIILNR